MARGRRFPGLVGAWAALTLLALGLSRARGSSYEVFEVEGSSMAPTLRSGEWLLGRPVRVVDVRADVLRGEVVVARIGSELVIKRVAAVAGDTLAVSGGRVLVNGRPAQAWRSLAAPGARTEPPRPWHFGFLLPRARTHRYAPTPLAWGPLVVPNGSVFLLGDNPRESGDSRQFGFAEANEIVAMVRYRVFPWPGRVGAPQAPHVVAPPPHSLEPVAPLPGAQARLGSHICTPLSLPRRLPRGGGQHPWL